MNSLLQDARFGLRMLWKSPAFAILSILTLALGIGANTAIFSVINTILLQPLPYPEPNRLIKLFSTSAESSRWPHSPANFFDYREQNRVFESLAAYYWTRIDLAEPGQPAESLNAISATADFFRVLRTQPFLGRVFTAEEESSGGSGLVVLSHGAWVRRFGADSNVLSRTIRVDGEKAAIIGVMPESIDYPLLWGHVEAWRPLTLTPEQRQDRSERSLRVVGRLKDKITLEQARVDVSAIAARLSAAYPKNNALTGAAVGPLHESVGDGASRKFAWFMLALTGFVLLIACANLANLQLARASTRTQEVAVRLALGAGRARLVRQMFVESFIVAVAGGVIGLFFAVQISKFIGDRVTFPSGYQGLTTLIDGTVLGFAFTCAIATALVFGIAPAWFAARAKLNPLLKSGARGATIGRSQNRVRHGLIVAEVALALTLLTGAGLVIGGLKSFISRDAGWKVDGLVSGWVFLDGPRYKTVEDRQHFITRLENELAALPGLESFGVSSSLPVWSFGRAQRFQIQGRAAPPPGQEPLASLESVTPGYFTAMKLRLQSGRTFNASDSPNAPDVVIINEAMARAFWPGDNPLGKRIASAGTTAWREVVGVISDIRFPANLNAQDTLWQIYRPLAQEPSLFLYVQLRPDARSGTTENVMAQFRRVVAGIDPDLAVNELELTRTIVDRLLANFRLASLLLGAFAVLGLLLAAIGIYGVIACFVAERTGEMGIRIALGARAADVLWLVLRKGLILALIGLVVGLLGAFGISRALAAAVPELRANSSAMTCAVVAVIMTATVFACWLPARRASRIEPMAALRQD